MPFDFNYESYYLLRCNKYVAIFNIVERGWNFVVFNMRGLELQETTSCHHLEAQHIDNIIKDIYEDKKKYYTHYLSIL